MVRFCEGGYHFSGTIVSTLSVVKLIILQEPRE